MRQSLMLVITIIVCFCLVSGCSVLRPDSSENGEDSDRPADGDSVKAIDEAALADLNALRTLLPDQAGYQWCYQGFAEYGALLTLEEINDSGQRVEYVVRGEVEDMSSGEANADFSVTVTYVIADSRLRQIKQEQVMLDSEFVDLTLIKTPLEVGTTWTESVVDKDSREVVITGEITGISTARPIVYSVRYDSVDGEYWEERMIKQGIGVISFRRSMTLQGETFEVGCYLWEDMSGYLK